jgi:hypothetical protein
MILLSLLKLEREAPHYETSSRRKQPGLSANSHYRAGVFVP